MHVRTRVSLALAAALAATTLALGAGSPASAAFGEQALLQLKGNGSTFSGSHSTAALAVPAGGTSLFTVKVVNTGAIAARFHLITYGDGAVSLTTTTGGKLTPAIDFGYITPVIKPGATFSATAKVKTVGTTQHTYVSHVQLYDVAPSSYTPTLFDEVTLITEVRAPLTGGSAVQVFARNAGLSYVGGSVSGQTAGGPALKVGASSTFTVRIRNAYATPLAVTPFASGPSAGCTGFTETIKSGSTDVTTAWRNGSFQTPVLATGASKDYTVIVKRVAPDPGCPDPGLRYTAGPTSVSLGVPSAV